MNKTILAVAVVASLSVGATTVFADTKQAATTEVTLSQIDDAFAGVETMPVSADEAKTVLGAYGYGSSYLLQMAYARYYSALRYRISCYYSYSSRRTVCY